MGKKEQIRDLGIYYRLIRKCKKHSWLFNTPFRHVEKLFFRNHKTLPLGKYYPVIMSTLGIEPSHDLDYYYNELTADQLLKDTFKSETKLKNGQDFENIYKKRFSRENYVVNYYALIREMKPGLVVETGTASGDLTSWVLAAMARNGNGRLLSIDIPPEKGKLTMSSTLSQDTVGRLIPAEYRDRWDYYPGDAKKLLPRVLAENDVDVFIHDSLHTRTHMLFEYNCARALMKPGAVIISHDILWNKAFFRFTESHNLQGFSSVADPNLGLTINEFEHYEEQIGLGIIEVDQISHGDMDG